MGANRNPCNCNWHFIVASTMKISSDIQATCQQYQPAGLLRRLGAILSDSLVIFGLLALTTLIVFVPILHMLGKNAMVPAEVGWLWSGVYTLTMLSVCFSFFGYFWGHSGQTIGMRAWRVKVETCDGRLVTWGVSVRRWALALSPWLISMAVFNQAEVLHSTLLKAAGAGFILLGVAGLLVMYASPERLTWYDRLSKSRVILLPEL